MSSSINIKLITLNILNEKYTSWHLLDDGVPCDWEILRKNNESIESTWTRTEEIVKILNSDNYDIILLQEVGKIGRKLFMPFLEDYYVVGWNNFNEEQITFLKKSKFKDVKIEYAKLHRMINVTCKIKETGNKIDKDLLVINCHLPYGDDVRKPYDIEINKRIKKWNKEKGNKGYLIVGGDMNASNKLHLYPDLVSLVKQFDDDKFKTSYSRGECNEIYKIKDMDKRYEFVDQIYISKNIQSSKTKIFNKLKKGKLVEGELFKKLQPPYFNSKKYKKKKWPTDHALLYVKLKISNDENTENNENYYKKYIKYKNKYNDLKKLND